MQCYCRECVVSMFKVAEEELGIFISNHDTKERQYIIENRDVKFDLTDIQLQKIFDYGFEFVDYTVTDHKKLGVIVSLSNEHKGHTIDSWN